MFVGAVIFRPAVHCVHPRTMCGTNYFHFAFLLKHLFLVVCSKICRSLSLPLYINLMYSAVSKNKFPNQRPHHTNFNQLIDHDSFAAVKYDCSHCVEWHSARISLHEKYTRQSQKNHIWKTNRYLAPNLSKLEATYSNIQATIESMNTTSVEGKIQKWNWTISFASFYATPNWPMNTAIGFDETLINGKLRYKSVHTQVVDWFWFNWSFHLLSFPLWLQW